MELQNSYNDQPLKWQSIRICMIDVLPLLCSVSSNFMKNKFYTSRTSTMFLKFLIKIHLFDSDRIVSHHLEKMSRSMIRLPWGMHSSLHAAAWHLKNSDKNYWARASLNKVIKNGSHISNRTTAGLTEHSFSSDEFSKSCFLLTAQLLKPSFNFLQWRLAHRSFYHSMRFFLPFNWPRVHQVTCK